MAEELVSPPSGIATSSPAPIESLPTTSGHPPEDTKIEEIHRESSNTTPHTVIHSREDSRTCADRANDGDDSGACAAGCPKPGPFPPAVEETPTLHNVDLPNVGATPSRRESVGQEQAALVEHPSDLYSSDKSNRPSTLGHSLGAGKDVAHGLTGVSKSEETAVCRNISIAPATTEAPSQGRDRASAACLSDAKQISGTTRVNPVIDSVVQKTNSELKTQAAAWLKLRFDLLIQALQSEYGAIVEASKSLAQPTRTVSTEALQQSLLRKSGKMPAIAGHIFESSALNSRHPALAQMHQHKSAVSSTNAFTQPGAPSGVPGTMVLGYPQPVGYASTQQGTPRPRTLQQTSRLPDSPNVQFSAWTLNVVQMYQNLVQTIKRTRSDTRKVRPMVR